MEVQKIHSFDLSESRLIISLRIVIYSRSKADDSSASETEYYYCVMTVDNANHDTDCKGFIKYYYLFYYLSVNQQILQF